MIERLSKRVRNPNYVEGYQYHEMNEMDLMELEVLEMKLVKAQELFIKSCHKFCGESIELPNNGDCFECESYPVFKALGESSTEGGISPSCTKGEGEK
jgi:hypothetical protein